MASGETLPYPDRRYTDLVADHAASAPDTVAVRQWDTVLTYRQLCTAAGELAATLRANGPHPLIGVCADRQPMLVAGLLGVLASGAAYVPLDPPCHPRGCTTSPARRACAPSSATRSARACSTARASICCRSRRCLVQSRRPTPRPW
ncbi:AMP-binding protein [Catellatospora coxensis]